MKERFPKGEKEEEVENPGIYLQEVQRTAPIQPVLPICR